MHTSTMSDVPSIVHSGHAEAALHSLASAHITVLADAAATEEPQVCFGSFQANEDPASKDAHPT
jgi:hypothetical protein